MFMKRAFAVFVLVANISFAQQSATSSQPSSATASDLANLPFRNPALPIDERVNDLISRMSLEEKVSQMRDRAVAIPRLGVPQYDWWNEGLHGVAFAGYATNFPQVIGMAATWDTDLVHTMAQTISPKRGPSTTKPSATTSTRDFSGSPFGPPISTSSAIPAGDAGRKLTEKIRFSPGEWRWRSSAACRGRTRSISEWFPPPSTTPCTAVPSL